MAVGAVTERLNWDLGWAKPDLERVCMRWWLSGGATGMARGGSGRGAADDVAWDAGSGLAAWLEVDACVAWRPDAGVVGGLSWVGPAGGTLGGVVGSR